MKNEKANALFHHHSSTAASSKKTSGLLVLTALLFAASGVLSAQAGKSYSQLKAEHPGWSQVPGQLIRPDCVHRVAKGSQLEIGTDGYPNGNVKMNGQVIAHYDACPEEAIDTRGVDSQRQHDPGTGGWVEDSEWQLSLSNSDNIDVISNDWLVPPYPSQSGALVYLFNGVEPTKGGYIMQPVLQFGDNGSFGGEYYSLASWLVGPPGSGIVFVSDPITVNPGDEIWGLVEETGVSGNTLSYFVQAVDLASGASTYLPVEATGFHWTLAFEGVLEAYNVTSCAQFSSFGSIQFAHTFLAHGFPKYDYYGTLKFGGVIRNYGGPSCGFAVNVNGRTATLDF
jgi:hypothetical protein